MSMIDSKNLFLNTLNETDILTQDRDINEKKCLISDELLEKNYIKLDCQHCFNYIPIYNEVVYQKTKRILDNRFLKNNQIKCPYCRTITNNLLPYIKYYDVKNLPGVTCNNGLQMYGCQQCNYVYKYKKKQHKCNNLACNTDHGFLCNKHIKYTLKDSEIIETIDSDTIKFYKKQTVIKLKNILKENKLKQTGNKEELVNRILINLIN